MSLNSFIIFPFPQLDQHIEEVCPKTKMICEFEYIGCTHRVSLYNLIVDFFFECANRGEIRRHHLQWQEDSKTLFPSMLDLSVR